MAQEVRLDVPGVRTVPGVACRNGNVAAAVDVGRKTRIVGIVVNRDDARLQRQDIRQLIVDLDLETGLGVDARVDAARTVRLEIGIARNLVDIAAGLEVLARVALADLAAEELLVDRIPDAHDTVLLRGDVVADEFAVLIDLHAVETHERPGVANRAVDADRFAEDHHRMAGRRIVRGSEGNRVLLDAIRREGADVSGAVIDDRVTHLVARREIDAVEGVAVTDLEVAGRVAEVDDRAVAAGGIDVMEITFRTAAAEESIKLLKGEIRNKYEILVSP